MTRWKTTLLTMGCLLVLGGPLHAAPPCVDPTDPDDDGICDPDDNCPLIANADQEDADADDIGDLCDRPLNLTIAKLRGTRNLSNPNGSMRFKGDFLTQEVPSDVFDLSPPGLFLDATDSYVEPRTVSATLSASDCVIKPSGLIKCRSTDKKVKALFKPIPAAPAQFRFTIVFRKQPIERPFVHPVRLTISHGPGIIRQAEIDECRATATGIICRQL